MEGEAIEARVFGIAESAVGEQDTRDAGDEACPTEFAQTCAC